MRSQGEVIDDLYTEIQSLRAQNAALQATIDGMHDRVTSKDDVFGRKNSKDIWTDVPKDDYDRLMSMPEEKRNRILEKMEGNWRLAAGGER